MRFKVIPDGDGFAAVWENNTNPELPPVATVGGFARADQAQAFIQDLLVKIARSYQPTN